MIWLSVAVLPMLLWRSYVGFRLWPALGWEAFWHSTGDLGWPFVGILELWSQVWQLAYFPGQVSFSIAAFWFPALLVLALAIFSRRALRERHPLAMAGVVYSLVGLCLTYDKLWIHIGNAQRGTFEVFLTLAILSSTDAARDRTGRLLRAVVWCAAGGYILWGAFDADYIRETLIATAKRVVSL